MQVRVLGGAGLAQKEEAAGSDPRRKLHEEVSAGVAGIEEATKKGVRETVGGEVARRSRCSS